MAGVSVDTGPSPAEVDFRAISEGGQFFLSRAQALSDLKSQNDMAIATLKLGTDARSALDDGLRKQAEASAKLTEAAKVLDDARQTAAGIVAEANEKATAVVSQAQSNANAVAAASEQTRMDAEAYAAQTKAAADEALKNAKAIEANTSATNDQVKSALVDAQVAKAAHDDARSQADGEKARYVKLRETMKTFVAGLEL